MYNQFHPLLSILLTKLADPKYSVRDVVGERHDWVKAGCPVSPPAAAQTQLPKGFEV